MSRQIGTVLGISMPVAVLGRHTSYAATHPGFEHGWRIIAGAAFLSSATAFGMTPRKESRQGSRRPLLAFADRR